MTGKRIVYIRVSTADQNPDRQLEGVQIDKKFIEYATARDTKRPQLQMMLDYAREDDMIIAHSMDRLARNLKDLKALIEGLVERRIQVHFVKENLTFTHGKESAMSNLLLNIMGAFAEFEHAFILERTREGIAIAKKMGRYRCRGLKISGPRLDELKNELTNTRKTKCQISEDFGITRHTLYNYIKKFKEQGISV